jgi:hypothetical protein
MRLSYFGLTNGETEMNIMPRPIKPKLHIQPFNLSEINVYEIAGRKTVSAKIRTHMGEMYITEQLLQSIQGKYYVNRHSSGHDHKFLLPIFRDNIFVDLKKDVAEYIPTKEIYDALDREIDLYH